MSLIHLQHLKNQINLNFQKFSKFRIIQKNLVHFQGFPEELNDVNILASPEYFGQYGTINKICLVPIKDNRTYHSAYITFQTEEQAAYCILAVDSIKIKNHLVRAFFGTTKYCNNFIKGYPCLNKTCKFLHYIADNKNDIIINDIKFGYSEHINLAKKIIGFGSLKSLDYINKNYNLNIKHILPDIRHIYSFEHINDKNKNHRKQSTSSNNYTNNTNNSGNNSGKDNDTMNDSFNSITHNINEFINEFLEDDDYDKKNNNEEEKYEEKKEDKKEEEIPNKFLFKNKNIHKIIDGLLQRKSFFKQFEKYDFGKSLLLKNEIDYCHNLFNETKDEEINKIIKYKIF